MGKEPVNIRCSPDTIEAVETYAEDNDISKAEAYRRVIREGVMLYGYSIDVPSQQQDEKMALHQEFTPFQVVTTLLLTAILALQVIPL